MIVVLWGVSGCGKTTVGKELARQLSCSFFDADDFHPESNIAKMRAGIPLTDDDRWPWLDAIVDRLRDEQFAVLACSALRRSYRERLGRIGETKFVLLRGSFDLIAQRLAERKHEFMNPELLQSQFDTLEVDAGDLAVDIRQSPKSICRAIDALGLTT